MIINDTTGNVEIPIRDFTELMLCIESLFAKVKVMIREEAEEAAEAMMSAASDKMTLAEFVSLSQEWLAEKGKECAVFRFAGHWAHVNNKGAVVGAWVTVDDALEETHCHNKCDAAMFGAA